MFFAYTIIPKSILFGDFGKWKGTEPVATTLKTRDYIPTLNKPILYLFEIEFLDRSLRISTHINIYIEVPKSWTS